MEPQLPLIRYRFRFSGSGWHQNRPWLQGIYPGSAWRGAFGTALRKAVCITSLPVCDSCMLLESCVYPWLFESRTPPDSAKLTRYPRTPGPFVLEPADSRFDSEADTLNLGVVLFGQANEQLPYVVHALEQAGRKGLTSRRIRLELEDLQVEGWSLETARNAGEQGDGMTENTTGCSLPASRSARLPERGGSHDNAWTTIHAPGGRLSPVPARNPPVPLCPQSVGVRILTPLRIRRDNHLVNEKNFDFRGFAGVLVRRISMLTTFFSKTPLETDFAGLLKGAESVAFRKSELRWHEWARYSSRQKSTIPMGGLVGSFMLEGELELIWPYLWLGQWTHAGRGCSMGLGRYALALPEDTSEDAVGGGTEMSGLQTLYGSSPPGL